MNARGGEKLYTPELLALAVDLAGFPLTEDLTLRGSARSPTCGSRAEVGFSLSGELVANCGIKTVACAIGQASCAILMRSAKGRPIADIVAMPAKVSSWLAGEDPLPDWPGFDAIEPAREFPARHGAILMPWNAAAEALSNEQAGS